MAKFKLEDYATVEERLKIYAEDNPDYRLATNIVHYSETDKVVIKAVLFKNAEEYGKQIIHASGIAEESPEGYVNQTSRVENCETSAIGRALANAGYQGKKDSKSPRPSREEMEKVARISEAKKAKPKSNATQETPPFEETVVEDRDDIIDTMESITQFNEVVQYFNSELAKRKGDEATLFREKYFPIAQKRMSELKG
jgi:hypothetical protein